MKSKGRVMTAAVLLYWGTATLLSGQPAPPELARGARHVEEGDFIGGLGKTHGHAYGD